ncbi:MAG: ATP-binding protein [Alistipes sp.]|jgi:GTPase SAR1 family protein|nr:ATP-binding protein [Alistipes sp.]
MKALSPTDILRMKKATIPFTGAWEEAFGSPEWVGVWIVWGNSASGKTSFVMQLCKELARWKRVVYNSLEQRSSLTMQNAVRDYNMQQCRRGGFQVIPGEPLDKFSERLLKPRSPEVVVIDSYQYTQMGYKDYIAFKERHPDKLIIFISHADGAQPDGRAAKKVKYDAELKVYVDKFRAFSLGRTVGQRGYYTIWEERAKELWGEE